MAETNDAANEAKAPEPTGRRDSWFDLPELFRWDLPELLRWEVPERLRESRIRVEEEMVGDKLVIRAEMPGIDPDNDVEITVSDDTLHLRAERRRQSRDESQGRVRTEFRYGSFTRTIPLPKGSSPDAVEASYHDGILEITVPVSAGSAEKRKVAVTRS